MERSARSEELNGVTMNSLVEQVLPFRSSKYIEDFCEKMLGEGIASPSDLLRVTKEIFEIKLRTHANFNFIEMADALSLRKAIDPVSAKDARSKQNGRRTARGGRGRSRSSRRCGKNVRDNSEGRGGQRNKSRPHRSSNNGNRSNDNWNNKDKVKPELWIAVAQGDTEKVRELLTQGQDPKVIFEGWSLLMKASEEGYEDIMRLLLDTGKIDIEFANRKNRTALSFAAAPSNDGSTPLNASVWAIHLLLQNGADANKKDVTGATAKGRALRENRLDAVAAFEAFGF